MVSPARLPSSLHYLQQIRPESPDLAILVRVKNEIKALPEFWRRLESQSCFDRCEPVFLDSGSNDGTVEFLSSLPCTLCRIAPEDFNFSSGCNIVMAISKAPVALLISAHVFLTEPNDLKTILQTMNCHKFGAGYLRQIPNDYFGSNAYERAFLAKRFPNVPSEQAIELNHPASFSNAASVLTRESWLRNPFPDVNASEDFLWAKEHLRMGGKLFYFPHVKVLHSHNETSETVFRRVRINVEARGLSGSYAKAAMYCAGVFAAALKHGASANEAWSYAVHHAKAYL